VDVDCTREGALGSAGGKARPIGCRVGGGGECTSEIVLDLAVLTAPISENIVRQIAGQIHCISVSADVLTGGDSVAVLKSVELLAGEAVIHVAGEAVDGAGFADVSEPAEVGGEGAEGADSVVVEVVALAAGAQQSSTGLALGGTRWALDHTPLVVVVALNAGEAGSRLASAAGQTGRRAGQHLAHFSQLVPLLAAEALAAVAGVTVGEGQVAGLAAVGGPH
jgi:hypothetical protein